MTISTANYHNYWDVQLAVIVIVIVVGVVSKVRSGAPDRSCQWTLFSHRIEGYFHPVDESAWAFLILILVLVETLGLVLTCTHPLTPHYYCHHHRYYCDHYCRFSLHKRFLFSRDCSSSMQLFLQH